MLQEINLENGKGQVKVIQPNGYVKWQNLQSTKGNGVTDSRAYLILEFVLH